MSVARAVSSTATVFHPPTVPDPTPPGAPLSPSDEPGLPAMPDSTTGVSGSRPRRRRRWSATIPLVVGAGACVVALSTQAVAEPPADPSAPRAWSPPVTALCDASDELDGFVVGWVPRGVGSLVTDFSYEWEDVAHRSRVWETGPDTNGAYRVDLTVAVLRGERLRDIDAVRDYLAEYLERDAEQWGLRPFRHLGRPGYHNDVETFWLAEPGVAVRVHVDGERFTEGQLMRTARSIRPMRG
ncbi:hypothetical protein [Thermasporomyces composti]|uniref:Uncharacterized protein n=1 Tax=Thermasporomyces composti TaxID=696763 RepID=A0A3D9V5R0_THECX|nr:hypothetical protein [Thermasporomyces composti]REF36799.1 hypothetical protein DFJ64_2231 [Thermasporomyces composti]